MLEAYYSERRRTAADGSDPGPAVAGAECAAPMYRAAEPQTNLQ